MAFQVHVERPTTGQVWEMVAIGEIKVTKSKNEPASCQATFLRDKMTVEEGDILAVQLDERGMDDFNLFYGYVKKTSKVLDEVTVTAYDQLYNMKLSKIIKSFGDIKASDLYKQLNDELELFMLEPPNVVDSKYKIPGVVADGASPLDLMTDALNSTYSNTGKQYYIFDMFKNLCMEELEKYRIPKTSYEFTTENVKSYTYEEDGSEKINEVIIKSNDEKNTNLAVRRDKEDIKKRGAVTFEQKIKDGENAEEVANQIFGSKRKIVPKMNLSVYGCNPQVIPGRLVHVDYYSARKEFIYGWFIVEDCTYTLKDGSGDMDLTLTLYDMEDEVFGS